MRKIFFVVLMVISLITIYSCKKSSTGPDEPSVVTFVDANFEVLIREILEKPTGDITNVELSTITSLRKRTGNINDLTGIA